jgi:lipopolysaccharide export system protein LptA
MRGTRWLLLAAILALVVGVGLTYRARKRTLSEQAPPKPAALPDDLNSSAQDWTYTLTTSQFTKVEITAREARQIKDSSRVDLRKVALKLHDETNKTYDLVTSEAASFFQGDHRFVSEGDVQITLYLPEENTESKRKPITIQTSGLTYAVDTGRAETDRPASFVFANGQGHATGAVYDQVGKELQLKQNVVLDWKPPRPRAKPMRIEGGSLRYREEASEIWLMPWGKLTRDKTVIEGENVVVHLQKHEEGAQTIRKIDALKAHGTDDLPRRKLQYSADELWVDCDDEGEIRKVTAQTNARLQATSDTSEMNASAYHVEMDFETASGESLLKEVSSSGDSVIGSKPIPAPGRQLPESHILRSDKLTMTMRPDGREIQNVVTHSPGTLEFLPNLPVQRHRKLDGNDMFIAYGPQNRIESFRASQARTQTDPNAEELKRKRPTSFTTSRTIRAAFEPKTGRMTNIEQAGDFTYEEGDRHARAAAATLDGESNVIVLDTAARVWDSAGATSADRIRLDQRTDDFTAEGNVNTSRLPDRNANKNSQMLSGDEPLQAQAAKMVSTRRNRLVHYEGGVALWQGANRIQADTVDLDRDLRTLVANGHVITNLWESPRTPPAGTTPKKQTAAPPVLTEVRAGRLVYTEEGRLAHYTGGVVLKRPRLEVRAREIRAWLSAGSADSSLEKAFADGDTRILMESSPDRTRTGTAEHSEYYAGEQRIVLTGGAPKLVDSKNGATTGETLVYFANDDRLLVSGTPEKPAESTIKRKK